MIKNLFLYTILIFVILLLYSCFSVKNIYRPLNTIKVPKIIENNKIVFFSIEDIRPEPDIIGYVYNAANMPFKISTKDLNLKSPLYSVIYYSLTNYGLQLTNDNTISAYNILINIKDCKTKMNAWSQYGSGLIVLNIISINNNKLTNINTNISGVFEGGIYSPTTLDVEVENNKIMNYIIDDALIKLINVLSNANI